MRTSPRRLDLWDAVILIVATGAGVEAWLVAIGFLGDPPLRGSPAIDRAMDLLLPLLFAWTLAIPALRLRRPCPQRRGLFGQPGMAACAVALAVLVCTLVGAAASWPVHQSRPKPTTFPGRWILSVDGRWMSSAFDPRLPPLQQLGRLLYYDGLGSSWAGLAICGAWLTMALGGWWRPERSAIDRLGRAIGLVWIVLSLGVLATLAWLDTSRWVVPTLRF